MNEKVAMYQRLQSLGTADDDSLIDFERKTWEEDAGFVREGNVPEMAPPKPLQKEDVLDQFRKTLTHVEKQMVKEVEAETELARQRFNDMQAKRLQDIEQRKMMLRERKRRKATTPTAAVSEPDPDSKNT